ncbi:aspartate aminotransferase family protein [Nocardioides marmotae]|uniref:aspartate aminotransferase family protein n=1 Tax=Nocardioides marmotae TaxID=2663857 RepID=UPI0012B5C8E0|nr:aspartate aminotransferase family protein [Nocardioides marmotae]MBC9733996.1 aspartate aminotransferase family protein [Nocardioides marmotae]MTB85099.1 aminotransferase class III-fold pyridoxal phosphate-dependent enzyme [Nocardioides marmotae]
MTIAAWPASERAWERTKGSLAGGVSTGLRASMKPHPIFVEGGAGPRLTDLDGNSYLDYVLGWGPVILGHGHPGLTAAVSAQLPLGATYGTGHLLEAEVAEKVLDRIPGMERVLWSNTGTEATQVALRLARGVTGRRRFIKFGGHYHGWSDPMLVGYRPGADGTLGLGSQGQNPSALEDLVLVEWGDLDAVAEVLKAPDSDIAAIFCEPVLCNSGVIEPPEGFLAGLRELCDATGTVLVFDEVITGFRIDRGGAVTRYGVTPDLVTLAKAIAGGYPLAAIAGRASILERTTQGIVHAGTYNGNPVVLAAAGATLDALDEPGVYDAFERQGRALADGIRAGFARHGLAVTVNQVGPVVQCIAGVADARTFTDFIGADQEFYDRLTVQLLRRGVFTLPGGRWYLSTAHTDADVAHTVQVLDDALAATLAEGPGPVAR